MPNTTTPHADTAEKRANPHFLPNFHLRQWLLVVLLCAAGLWLAISRTTNTPPEFESASMVSAKADYYLESFTLMSTKPNGDTDYTLTAETLIHLPTEELARVNSPSLIVNSNSPDASNWELTATTGLLPDDGQTIELLGGVQLLQLAGDQTPVRLTTPNLLLNRQQMLLSSDTGVSVDGPGWQLQADRMTGEIETGKLIFRDNSHAQYTTQKTK